MKYISVIVVSAFLLWSPWASAKQSRIFVGKCGGKYTGVTRNLSKACKKYPGKLLVQCKRSKKKGKVGKWKSTRAITCSKSSKHKMKKCPASGYQKLAKVFAFLDDFYNPIVKGFVFAKRSGKARRVSRRHRRKFRRLKVKCARKSNSMCKKPRRYGYASGSSKTVNLCPYAFTMSFCGLVEAIFHESGHTARLKKMKGHNDPDDHIFGKDKVYALGYKAKDACKNAIKNGLIDDHGNKR